MIATDLDGTLLGRGGVPSEANAAALRRAEAAGIRVAIVSGRLPAVISHLALSMGLARCWVIGLNGMQMLDGPYRPPVLSNALPRDAAINCLAILEEEGCPTTLYVPDGVMTNQRFETREAEARYRSYFEPSGVTVDVAPDAVSRGMEKTPLKILAKFPRGEEHLESVSRRLLGAPGIALTSAKRGTVEIMREGIDKRWALEKAAALLGIDRGQIMAFGDYENDVEMLAWAGLGIAMGNALEAVKAASDRVTLTNTESGVAYTVNRYLDEGVV